ncbi:MAG: TIR domain-containing protein, partial [Chloroflexota bacterium]
MTSIMVSYSRKDSAAARKLIESFQKLGLEVWVDWEDIPPAVGWLDQILQGIEESDAFIFCISPDSITSEVCKVEIGHAAKNNKRIIPVVLRDVNPKDVIETIRDLNWIFGREQDSFDDCLAKIKLAIELDIEWVGEHKRLQIRALEWDRKKDVSLLLRGRDLHTADRTIQLSVEKNPTPTELQHIYIKHSRRNQRLLYGIWISAVIVVLIMIGLAWTALQQAQLAELNRQKAEQREQEAIANLLIANQNEKKAQAAEKDARASENLAKAQRSAAKAQIYRTRPGELYTSTLFAIDSMRRAESAEAEEILRQNISLLPIPVAQMREHHDRLTALELSPAGETFLTASVDAKVCVWSLEDGRMLFCAASSGPVNDAAFSPNGELIATGDHVGHIMILNANDGTILKEIDLPDETPIWDVNISPDGKFLAVARDDRKITFYDLRTSEYKFAFEFFGPGSLRVSAFSPNGAWFAAGATNGTVTIWHLNSTKVLQGPAHRGEVLSIEFSPNSNRLVSGGADSAVLVTQTSTGAELFRILNEDWVEDIAFSPDSSWFVTVSDDRRVRVWDTESGEERFRMLQDSFVSEVQVSANGAWIATTGEDETIRLWDGTTGAQILQIPLDDGGSVLAFSKDQKYLVSGDTSGGVSIWNISEIATPSSTLQFSGFTSGAQFSASGGLLAVSDEGRVWLLDEEQLGTLTAPPQGQNTRRLDLRTNITDLLLSPDAKWIVLTTDTGELILYNVASDERKTLLQSNPAPGFVFSQDGSQLITASGNGKVEVWDLSSGKVLSTLREGERGVAALAAADDLLAIGLVDKIVIWDLEAGAAISEIDSAGAQLRLAFSADGSRFAAYNSSSQISVWQQNGTVFDLVKSLTPGNVFSMTFNPLGDQLLVGGQDVLLIYDSLTGGEIARIPHRDAVRAISFSADGATLATASFKVVQFWDVAGVPFIQPDQVVETACLRMVRNFDEAEWTVF